MRRKKSPLGQSLIMGAWGLMDKCWALQPNLRATGYGLRATGYGLRLNCKCYFARPDSVTVTEKLLGLASTSWKYFTVSGGFQKAITVFIVFL